MAAYLVWFVTCWKYSLDFGIFCCLAKGNDGDFMDKTKIETIRKGVQKYQFLRETLMHTDVSKDRDFQKRFNGFFRMGRRTEQYYADFYSYLEEHKASGVSFADALQYLYERHGRLEISFVSKMVAMVDPNYPIWDSVVAGGHFHMKAPYANVKDRLKLAIEKYDEYCRAYAAYMQTESAVENIAVFDRYFPGSSVSNVKKVDFILWQER